MLGSAAVQDAVEQQKRSRDSGAVRCCDRRVRQCGYAVPGERCMCAGCPPSHLWQCTTAGGPAHCLQPRRRTLLPLSLPSASTSSNCHQLQRCWSVGSRYNYNFCYISHKEIAIQIMLKEIITFQCKLEISTWLEISTEVAMNTAIFMLSYNFQLLL